MLLRAFLFFLRWSWKRPLSILISLELCPASQHTSASYVHLQSWVARTTRIAFKVFLDDVTEIEMSWTHGMWQIVDLFVSVLRVWLPISFFSLFLSLSYTHCLLSSGFKNEKERERERESVCVQRNKKTPFNLPFTSLNALSRYVSHTFSPSLSLSLSLLLLIILFCSFLSLPPSFSPNKPLTRTLVHSFFWQKCECILSKDILSDWDASQMEWESDRVRERERERERKLGGEKEGGSQGEGEREEVVGR